MRVAANGIEIEYEEFGPTKGSAILLIMGMGTQLIAWPLSLCLALAGAGFRVIRFDNRDTGLSTKFDAAPRVDVQMAMVRAMWGMPVGAPYSLRDMATDALGLMDALGISSAHIVGASMGGMIAQIIAGEHPARTRSLVSIMSTSSARHLPPPDREAFAIVMARRPPVSDRERAIAHAVQIYRTIGSASVAIDEAELRRRLIQTMDRSYYPSGVARHFLAILASGDRVGLLRRIRVPTLVLHGSDDPLVPAVSGRHVAELVPGAIFRIIEGMGHDLAPPFVTEMAEVLADHCRRADMARETMVSAQV